MSRTELIGESEQGHMAHLNCEAGTDNSLVADCDDGGGDIAYCFGCYLNVPNEVCETFEPMEDGLEKEDKPYSGNGGYDPPLWMFDGLEWKMS